MAKAHGPKFLALVEESRKRVGEFSIEEVKRKLDAGEKFPLIDVREGEKYAGGRRPRARMRRKGILESDCATMVSEAKGKALCRESM